MHKTGKPHGSKGSGGCGCGCCGCGHGFRRFFTAEERRESLENYKEQLKKELAGLEERIEECECK